MMNVAELPPSQDEEDGTRSPVFEYNRDNVLLSQQMLAARGRSQSGLQRRSSHANISNGSVLAQIQPIAAPTNTENSSAPGASTSKSTQNPMKRPLSTQGQLSEDIDDEQLSKRPRLDAPRDVTVSIVAGTNRSNPGNSNSASTASSLGSSSAPLNAHHTQQSHSMPHQRSADSHAQLQEFKARSAPPNNNSAIQAPVLDNKQQLWQCECNFATNYNRLCVLDKVRGPADRPRFFGLFHANSGPLLLEPLVCRCTKFLDAMDVVECFGQRLLAFELLAPATVTRLFNDIGLVLRRATGVGTEQPDLFGEELQRAVTDSVKTMSYLAKAVQHASLLTSQQAKEVRKALEHQIEYLRSLLQRSPLPNFLGTPQFYLRASLYAYCIHLTRLLLTAPDNENGVSSNNKAKQGQVQDLMRLLSQFAYSSAPELPLSSSDSASASQQRQQQQQQQYEMEEDNEGKQDRRSYSPDDLVLEPFRQLMDLLITIAGFHQAACVPATGYSTHGNGWKSQPIWALWMQLILDLDAVSPGLFWATFNHVAVTGVFERGRKAESKYFFPMFGDARNSVEVVWDIVVSILVPVYRHLNSQTQPHNQAGSSNNSSSNSKSNASGSEGKETKMQIDSKQQQQIPLNNATSPSKPSAQASPGLIPSNWPLIDRMLSFLPATSVAVANGITGSGSVAVPSSNSASVSTSASLLALGRNIGPAATPWSELSPDDLAILLLARVFDLTRNSGWDTANPDLGDIICKLFMGEYLAVPIVGLIGLSGQRRDEVLFDFSGEGLSVTSVNSDDVRPRVIEFDPAKVPGRFPAFLVNFNGSLPDECKPQGVDETRLSLYLKLVALYLTRLEQSSVGLAGSGNASKVARMVSKLMRAVYQNTLEMTEANTTLTVGELNKRLVELRDRASVLLVIAAKVPGQRKWVSNLLVDDRLAAFESSPVQAQGVLMTTLIVLCSIMQAEHQDISAVAKKLGDNLGLFCKALKAEQTTRMRLISESNKSSSNSNSANNANRPLEIDPRYPQLLRMPDLPPELARIHGLPIRPPSSSSASEAKQAEAKSVHEQILALKKRITDRERVLAPILQALQNLFVRHKDDWQCGEQNLLSPAIGSMLDPRELFLISLRARALTVIRAALPSSRFMASPENKQQQGQGQGQAQQQQQLQQSNSVAMEDDEEWLLAALHQAEKPKVQGIQRSYLNAVATFVSEQSSTSVFQSLLANCKRSADRKNSTTESKDTPSFKPPQLTAASNSSNYQVDPSFGIAAADAIGEAASLLVEAQRFTWQQILHLFGPSSEFFPRVPKTDIGSPVLRAVPIRVFIGILKDSSFQPIQQKALLQSGAEKTLLCLWLLSMLEPNQAGFILQVEFTKLLLQRHAGLASLFNRDSVLNSLESPLGLWKNRRSIIKHVIKQIGVQYSEALLQHRGTFIQYFENLDSMLQRSQIEASTDTDPQDCHRTVYCVLTCLLQHCSPILFIRPASGILISLLERHYLPQRDLSTYKGAEELAAQTMPYALLSTLAHASNASSNNSNSNSSSSISLLSSSGGAELFTGAYSLLKVLGKLCMEFLCKDIEKELMVTRGFRNALVGLLPELEDTVPSFASLADSKRAGSFLALTQKPAVQQQQANNAKGSAISLGKAGQQANGQQLPEPQYQAVKVDPQLLARFRAVLVRGMAQHVFPLVRPGADKTWYARAWLLIKALYAIYGLEGGQQQTAVYKTTNAIAEFRLYCEPFTASLMDSGSIRLIAPAVEYRTRAYTFAEALMRFAAWKPQAGDSKEIFSLESSTSYSTVFLKLLLQQVLRDTSEIAILMAQYDVHDVKASSFDSPEYRPAEAPSETRDTLLRTLRSMLVQDRAFLSDVSTLIDGMLMLNDRMRPTTGEATRLERPLGNPEESQAEKQYIHSISKLSMSIWYLLRTLYFLQIRSSPAQTQASANNANNGNNSSSAGISAQQEGPSPIRFPARVLVLGLCKQLSTILRKLNNDLLANLAQKENRGNQRMQEPYLPQPRRTRYYLQAWTAQFNQFLSKLGEKVELAHAVGSRLDPRMHREQKERKQSGSAAVDAAPNNAQTQPLNLTEVQLPVVQVGRAVTLPPMSGDTSARVQSYVP